MAATSGESTASAGIAGSSAAEADADEEESNEPTKTPRLKRFTVAGGDLKNELQVLVKEDPDAAANILRTWIGEAA